MNDKLSEDNQEVLEARRAVNKGRGGGFNPGYKLDFTDQEVREATAVRDAILNEIAGCMNGGLPPSAQPVVALVERYRFEFIDQYLYRSTPIIILGLASTMAALPENRQAYEAYCPGLADYLSDAFRAYYHSLASE